MWDSRLLLVCLAVVYAGSQGSIDSERNIEDDSVNRKTNLLLEKHGQFSAVESYLKRFGYMDNSDGDRRRRRQTALREFQHVNHLRETGKLNRKTLERMSKPRCGVSDNALLNKRRKRYASSKWDKSTLTWEIETFSSKMPRRKQRQMLKRALSAWEEFIPVTFQQVPRDGDIVVKFVRGEHGDGYYNRFDGKGMTLAHAYRPCDQYICGDTHFDEDENWVLRNGSYGNPSVLAVAMHEFGHAIGLEHSSHSNSVMAPYMDKEKVELTEEDVSRVQALYGKRYQKIKKTKRGFAYIDKKYKLLKKIPRCSGIDAIFYDRYRLLNVMVNNTVFKVYRGRRRQKAFPMPIAVRYTHGPDNVGAAAFVRGKLYIFKGSKVWRYTNNDLDLGYPKEVLSHRYIEEPTAAVLMVGTRNKRLFLFGRKSFWEWSFYSENTTGFRHSIQRFWRGVPNQPDAALLAKDKFYYFFKGNLYYKVHASRRQVEPGYPKVMPPPWMKELC